MTTSTQVDLVEFFTNTVGTSSPLAIGAATDGHRGSEAMVDGATYSYSIGQLGSYEVGRGIYSEGNQTITRGVLLSSNNDNPIAIQSGATISIVLLAEDLATIGGGGADFTIGTVTSGFPAAVTIRGISPNFILDFVLVTGEVGATGPAPNLTIGTTTVVASDQPPLVQITGTNPNYALNFTLPSVTQNGIFNQKIVCRSDTAQINPVFIAGIASQYTRITNYCVADGLPGSTSFGCGVLQVKWSADNKGIEDTICKSRATTIGGTPVSIQAGDVIYTQLWYGDAGPTVGAPTGSMAHIGWYRVAIDGAPLGDSTELPGWYGLAIGTGVHSSGSRYAFEANSRQQVHFPGPASNPFGPTGASWGALCTLGVGLAAAGGAPLKLTIASAALLAVPEAGAVEIDTAGVIYITNAAARRRQIIDADTTAPSITAGAGAGTAPTIALAGGPNSGRITLTTGTSPTLNGVIATVAYANAFPADSFVVFSPANDNAAATFKQAYVNGNASGFTVTNGSLALGAGTVYIWNFHILGK